MTDAEQLILLMEQKEVKHFIEDFCNGYHPYYKNSIEYVDGYLKRAMEMMNVSKEDLEEFMTNSM